MHTYQAQTGDLSRYRFRQVPTFGRDTIRKFGGSVSAMKKLAGRDFEDILQVGVPLPSPLDTTANVLSLPSSVGSRSSRASCRMSTTRSCSTSPSTWPHGTPMQNFVCTRLTQSSPYGRRQKSSVVNSAATPRRFAPSTRRSRYRERPLLLIASGLCQGRQPVH